MVWVTSSFVKTCFRRLLFLMQTTLSFEEFYPVNIFSCFEMQINYENCPPLCPKLLHQLLAFEDYLRLRMLRKSSQALDGENSKAWTYEGKCISISSRSSRDSTHLWTLCCQTHLLALLGTYAEDAFKLGGFNVPLGVARTPQLRSFGGAFQCNNRWWLAYLRAYLMEQDYS